MQDNIVRRNAEIAAALDKGGRGAAKGLAREHGLSVSHIYRIGKHANGNGNGTDAERFAATNDQTPTRSMVGGGLFKELGVTGLRRFAGTGEIYEEYDRVWKPLNKKCAIIREMADDAICAAVEMAVRMTLRRVGWYVEPGGDSDTDKEAEEWLETCKDDMSQSWGDTIDGALGMIKWGFQPAEIVYKKRAGLRDGQAVASSKFDDGRIGWRKWTFIAPDSLAPGSPWQFDEAGGLQSYTQQAPPDYQTVVIPMDKSLLFRTTTEKGNPEGKSLFRPMYRSYYMKNNFEEVEGISAERIGAGFPVAYLGRDVSKNLDDPNSDASGFQNALRNIRVDDQMSLIIPFSKMGSGAPEGEGVLFEFASPPGTKAIDFHQAITRYEQRMAMVGLAQFIHLGMNQVGARSLGESSTDFFTMAVTGWVDSIEETIHRYGTERLFRLNKWTGLTGYPRIKHESVSKVSLTEIADYISKLAGVGIIMPEPELEKHVRELADLPEKPIQVVPPAGPAGPVKPGQAPSQPASTTPETGDEEEAVEEAAEIFYNSEHDAKGRFAPGGGSGETSGGGNGPSQDSIDAVEGYQNFGYLGVNTMLRTPNEADSSDIKTGNKLKGKLDKAFEDAPPLSEDIEVYRGGRASDLGVDSAGALAGRTIVDKGYTSTSLDKDVAGSYASKYGSDGVVFKISVPRGTRILKFADYKAHSPEREVLINRGGRYRVTGVSRSGRTTTISMRYSR